MIRLILIPIPNVMLVVALLLVPQVAQAQASTPREQLQQLVSDLQQSPDDRALREKIIKLAQTIKPRLEIPEEARRYFVKAVTLQKDAKTKEDLDLVIEEYGQALLVAPWFGDAYFNLASAEQLAEHYETAARDLRLYLLTAPSESDARQAKDKLYEIEAKQEKADSDRRRAEREIAQHEALERNKPHSLVGKWIYRHFIGRTDEWISCAEVQRDPVDFEVRKVGGQLQIIPLGLSGFLNKGVTVDSIQATNTSVVFTTKSEDHRGIFTQDWNLELSSDGQELIGSKTDYFNGELQFRADRMGYCRQQ